jgi:hypothetical protein
LEINGLNGAWKGTVPLSDWEGEMAGLDFDGQQTSILNAIARLSTNLDPHNYNLSGIGPGEEVIGISHDGYKRIDDGIVGISMSVKKLSLPFFCRQLVHHFTIMFQRNKLKWPQHRRSSD